MAVANYGVCGIAEHVACGRLSETPLQGLSY